MLNLKPIIILLVFLPMSLMGQDWRPANPQKEEVERLYGEYYAIKDRGSFKQAYAYLAPATKQLIKYDRWLEIATKTKNDKGAIIAREIKKITWYNNPKGSESPGIYAAVDFVGRAEKANIYCGFVIWQQMETGGFALLREEENYIDKINELSLRKEGKLEEFKAKIGC